MASAVLFLVSLGKWSDPIIDSGSEWMYADSLARGQLLYRDVVYWFGPFTPYFQSIFLRVFGSSFVSLVISGIVGSLGTLAALYWALRRVSGRREAFLWTALAIPVLIFMPNSGGAILGMGYRSWHPASFSLLAVACAAAIDRRSAVPRAVLVGTLCAFAGLSRTEWGLMALAGAVVAFAFSRDGRSLWLRSAGLAAAVAVLEFSAAVALFVGLAGKQAVLDDGNILLTAVSPETRRFLVAFSHIREWPRGLAELAYSAAVWSAAILLCLWIALRPRVQRSSGFRAALAVTAGVAGIAAFAGGAGNAVFFSAAPLVCFLALGVGALRRGRPRAAALGGFGLLGLLAAHRRPFHIGDTPYVAPQLLFAFTCLAGLLHVLTLTVARKGPDERRRLMRVARTALSLLLVAAFAARMSQYASAERTWIPGTGRMLTASEQTARDIAATAEAVRAAGPRVSTLVVFPEGQVLNFLTEKPNPLRQKLYIPGYLQASNEPQLLDDLRRTRPDAIVLWPRPTEEYGAAEFGIDYGRDVLAWIEQNYAVSPIPSSRGRARLYLRSPDPRSPDVPGALH
ncbi:MAG: hypothetical protein ABW056_11275 [Thermoanaerobaculia bacterium]